MDYFFGVLLGWILKTGLGTRLLVHQALFNQLRKYLAGRNHLNHLDMAREASESVALLQALDPEYFRCCWTPEYMLSDQYLYPEWQNGSIGVSGLWLPHQKGKLITDVSSRRPFQKDRAMTICGIVFRINHAREIVRGFDSVWNLCKKTQLGKSSGIASLLDLFPDLEICDMLSNYPVLFHELDVESQIISSAPGELDSNQLSMIRDAIVRLSPADQYQSMSWVLNQHQSLIRPEHAKLCIRRGTGEEFDTRHNQKEGTEHWEVLIHPRSFDRGIAELLTLFMADQ